MLHMYLRAKQKDRDHSKDVQGIPTFPKIAFALIQLSIMLFIGHSRAVLIVVRPFLLSLAAGYNSVLNEHPPEMDQLLVLDNSSTYKPTQKKQRGDVFGVIYQAFHTN